MAFIRNFALYASPCMEHPVVDILEGEFASADSDLGSHV